LLPQHHILRGEVWQLPSPPSSLQRPQTMCGDRFGRDDRGGDDPFGGRGNGRGGGGFGFRNDDRGPPPVQNSRFAAMIEGDEDYVHAEVRKQRDRERRCGGGRFGDGGGGGDEAPISTGPRWKQEEDSRSAQDSPMHVKCSQIKEIIGQISLTT